MDTTERLHFHFSLSCIGEGNGNPLQCSCLENPRDGGAWWAAVYGVAQSRTRLKRLSSSSSSRFKIDFRYLVSGPDLCQTGKHYIQYTFLLDPQMTLWTKNVTCQRMLWPSSHHVTAMSMVSPEGTQDRNRMPTIKPSATAATPVPQQCTLRRLRMRKHRILALDS